MYWRWPVTLSVVLGIETTNSSRVSGVTIAVQNVTTLRLRNPDRYDSYDITSPIHNIYLLFFGTGDLIPYSI